MTKLTWDNAILIGPKMAERLQITSKDVVELELNGKKVTGAAWIQAGHPDNSVTVISRLRPQTRRPRGHRAAASTRIPCAPAPRPGSPPACRLRKTGDTYELASTQGYQTMDTPDGGHRPLVRETTLEEYRKRAQLREGTEEPAPGLTLYKPYPYKEEAYAWGMAIDLNPV